MMRLDRAGGVESGARREEAGGGGKRGRRNESAAGGMNRSYNQSGPGIEEREELEGKRRKKREFIGRTFWGDSF